MNNFYDGTKILSLKDANGVEPDLYLIVGNRSSGKTTYFNRLCVNRFQKYGNKFGLIYRYANELEDVHEKFFKDIKELFFKGADMSISYDNKKPYAELKLNDKKCGYALCLNKADSIKKCSHLLSDIDFMVFDEFMSETNSYLTNEVEKFLSVLTSVSRGRGQHVRRVPVYMLSNSVTLLNPYFTAMDISSKLQENTRFLRGDGFVLEQSYIEGAAIAQKGAGFMRALSKSKYLAYASQNVYLNDNKAFLDDVCGKFDYLANIIYMDKTFSIKCYDDKGIIYIDKKYNPTCKINIAVTLDDHRVNYVVLQKSQPFIKSIRDLFNRGCVRFKDLECKRALMTFISY